VIAFDFDEARRAFRVVIADGIDRWMPMLESDDFRGWNAQHARVYTEFLENAAALNTVEDSMRTEEVAEDQLIDAILAYDRTGVLGSRGDLEETLTVEQLMLIARRIARAHG
jgi:hypothetical protein